MADRTLESRRLLWVAALKKEEMLKLAENALQLALAKGEKETETYVYEGQSTSIGVERGQITKSNRIIDRGLGIRVVVNNAIGFAYTNILEKKSAVEDTIVKALSAARARKPDKDWHGLQDRKNYASNKNTYDP